MADESTPAKLGDLFTPDARYERQEAACELYRMLMGGTPALHANPRRWMPPTSEKEIKQYLGGVASDYDQRIDNATVEPYFSRAVKRDVASVLGKPVILGEDVPVPIRGDKDSGIDGWAENIDLRGNDLTNFLRQVALDATDDAGYSTVMVDFPTVEGEPTIADVVRLKLRPFWSHYKARDVIFAMPEMVLGRERAAEIRLRDAAPAGYERVRVLKPAPFNETTGELAEGRWATYELYQRRCGGGDDVELLKSGTMRPHQEIPLRPWYYDKVGFFEGRNPYLELAYENLKHARQDSRISEAFIVAAGALLHRVAATPEELAQRAVGARRMITTKDPGGRAEWLEQSGAGAKNYFDYSTNTEMKLERLGNEPHIQRTGSETATARGIDTAEAHTEIEARLLSAKDFTEELLMLTAVYIPGETTGGSVTIRKPPLFLPRDDASFAALVDMHVKTGVPRLVTLVQIAIAQARLPDDLDAEDEVELGLQERNQPPGATASTDAKAAAATEKVTAAIEAARLRLNGGGAALPSGAPQA